MNKQQQQLSAKFILTCEAGLDMCPSSVTLGLMRQALHLYNICNPQWMIETVGPFFFAHRTQIMEGNVDYFLQRSWQEQASEWGFMGAVAPLFEACIKDIIRQMKITDVKNLCEMPLRLIRIYSSYVLMSQKA